MNDTARHLLVAGVTDLALVVAALLSMGSAPTKHATFSIESAKPEAAEFAPTTPDSIAPSAIAAAAFKTKRATSRVSPMRGAEALP
jgi:hypothetical protein